MNEKQPNPESHMNSSNNIRFSRISRISHPRATLWAMALLIVVFLGFGIWAEAHVAVDNNATFIGAATHYDNSTASTWQTHLHSIKPAWL